VAFWHERSRTLFAGDLITRQGTVVIPASRGGNLADYLSSLRRVMALSPLQVLPSHGDSIDDSSFVLERYFRHRATRDKQILAAIRSGRSSLESIVDNVYYGMEEPLKSAARETVLAHLIKLEADGMILRDGNDWRAR
jgi:glyoxylase-like metal-dependent hydrolase (beta-lactamase superfamily II)